MRSGTLSITWASKRVWRKQETNSNMKKPETKVHLPSACSKSLDHASRKIHIDLYVEIGEKWGTKK